MIGPGPGRPCSAVAASASEGVRSPHEEPARATSSRSSSSRTCSAVGASAPSRSARCACANERARDRRGDEGHEADPEEHDEHGAESSSGRRRKVVAVPGRWRSSGPPTRAPVPCTADFSDVTLTGKRPSRRCLEKARCDPRSVDLDPTSTRIIASRACERRGATGRPSTHRIRQDCPTEHLHLRHRPSVGPRRAGPQPSIQARCRWSPPRRFSSCPSTLPADDPTSG